ncbi:pseudouridine synthase pus4 [Dimargaris xerosporica]|nr:pseudouridine synthase pus4 [Dimargaris xerosporica]
MPGIQIQAKLPKIKPYNGVLPLCKPYGFTSADCIRYLNLAIRHARHTLTLRNEFSMLGYDPLPSKFHYAGYGVASTEDLLATFPPIDPSDATLVNSYFDRAQLDPSNPADLFLYTLMSGLPSSLRRSTNKKYRLKLGHGGTLDPLASGLLMVTFGDGCQQSEALQRGYKTYVATGVLGVATDSMDLDGTIVQKAPHDHITQDTLEDTLNKFRGHFLQKPPRFSAIRVGGKRMYQIQRDVYTVPEEIADRPVHIKRLELQLFTRDSDPTSHSQVLQGLARLQQFRQDHAGFVQNSDLKHAIETSPLPRPPVHGITRKVEEVARELKGLPVFRIEAEVSGGTYIRSLVNDIGQSLTSAATVIDLVRTQHKGYTLDEFTANLLQCRDPFFLNDRIVPGERKYSYVPVSTAKL